MINCEHLNGTKCAMASVMANADAHTSEKACTVCLAQPDRTNHVTASLALNVIPKPVPAEKQYLYSLLKKVEPLPKQVSPELKQLISLTLHKRSSKAVAVSCEHAIHGICQVATKLAGVPAPLDADACTVCMKEVIPKSANRATAALACKARRLAKQPEDPALQSMAIGVYSLAGYRLERYIHKWLKRFRITPPDNCGCDSWVSKMNAWGVQGSLERLDEITDQLYVNLKETYLSRVATPWLAKPLIKQRVRACLLKEHS